MIVPRHWAQAVRRVPIDGRDVTVRRFGFSDESLDAARSHAESRVDAAVLSIELGEDVVRFERNEPYGGANGLPIREEIVSRHDDTIITRNTYGALCLNTPNVMFVDIDHDIDTVVEPAPTAFVRPNIPAETGLFVVGLAIVFLMTGHASVPTVIAILVVVAMAIAWTNRTPAISRPPTRREVTPSTSRDAKARLLERVRAFSKAHPDFHLRVYETPLGMRVLVMHRTFSAREAAVTKCFEELGADAVYARCCTSQNCFRARLTPKPWRIGAVGQISGGTWPVAETAMPRRATWIEAYTRASEPYAACRFIEALGTTRVTPETVTVQRLHDEACGARSDKPLA